MSDYPEGQGWWQASDLKWYPPEQSPGTQQSPGVQQPAQAPAPQQPPSGFSSGIPPAPGVGPGPGIPPAPGAAGYPGYPGAAPVSNNGMAVASMVVSIVSIFCSAGLLGIVGAILGHVAKGQIDKSGGTQGGRGMALAGIIIGWIAFALFIAYIVFVVALAGSSDTTWTFE